MLQFYSTNNEVSQYIYEIINKYDLKLLFFEKQRNEILGRYQQFPHVVEGKDISKDMLKRQFGYWLYPASHTFRSMQHDMEGSFLDDGNLGALHICLVNVWDNGKALDESHIGFKFTEDESLIKLWRKIIRDYRKTLMHGGWMVNTRENAKSHAYIKFFKYSKGAKQLYDNGSKIYCNGTQAYVLFEPEDAEELAQDFALKIEDSFEVAFANLMAIKQFTDTDKNPIT